MSLFIVLQNGIHIENLNVSSLKVNELYINWNEKLSVTANLIEISTKTDQDQKKLDLKQVQSILLNTELFIKWFEKISIEHIKFNDINGSFYYAKEAKGYLKLNSKTFDLNSTLELYGNQLHVKLHPLQLQNLDINVTGDTVFNITQNRLHSNLSTAISNDALLHVKLNATQDAIYYDITSDQPIKSLEKLVSRFKMNPIIHNWAIENIKAQQIDLEYIRGTYEFKAPEKFIYNLDAKARGLKLNYRFSEKLAPLKTQYTDVHFKDAVLQIRPHNGMFTHHKLPKGYLDIDFSKKQYHLFAYVITNTVLDKEILKILDTFGINLPLTQTSGTTDANLKLDINLHTLDTMADGIFKVKEGDFLFKGETLHAKNSTIHLLGTHVDVTKAHISYGSYIDADVTGFLDPVKNRADLHIKPRNITVEGISLNQSKLKLAVRYHLTSKKESLQCSPSEWNLYGDKLFIDAFDAPFRFNDFHVTLNKIGITIKDKLQTTVSGTLNIPEQKASIQTEIEQLNFNGLTLLDAPFTCKFNYVNKVLTFTTKEFNSFEYANQTIRSAPLQLVIKKKHLKILKSKFYIKDIVDFQLEGEYLFSEHTGTFNVEYIQTHLKDLYSSTKPLTLHLGRYDDHTLINCDELSVGAFFSLNKWQVTLSDFSKLVAYSDLLKKNFITQGNLTFFTTQADKSIQLSGLLEYPYAILVEDETPQNIFNIKGTYNNNVTMLNVNDKIDVKVAKDITIDAHDIGFNVLEILTLLNAQEKAESTAPQLTIHATNSFLYISPRRRALIDTMSLTKYKQELNAKLSHHKGSAVLTYKDDYFHLTGDDFDDVFMNNLLALSEHKEGSLYFYMYGQPKNFQGLLRVRDTILKDYKVINNTLAFINTLPALSTFSLPQYSSKGLRVKEVYGGFTYNNKNITIHDANLDSKELKMSGNGNLNFEKNSIDMSLHVKTDLGSKLSKVPLVGYLLFGDDGSVSTTVTISGKLNDPTVSNAVAKEIIVSPFNLLKRTIMLPMHLIEQAQ
jgi:hypothetical protein